MVFGDQNRINDALMKIIYIFYGFILIQMMYLNKNKLINNINNKSKGMF